MLLWNTPELTTNYILASRFGIAVFTNYLALQVATSIWFTCVYCMYYYHYHTTNYYNRAVD